MKIIVALISLFFSADLFAQEIVYATVPQNKQEKKERRELISASDRSGWSKDVSIVLKHQRNYTGLNIGSQFPKRGFVDINKETISSSLFNKGVVVVNFWFVGCGGCKIEEETLKEISSHYSNNKKLIFISFSRSDEKKVKKHFEKYGNFGYQTVASLDKDEYDKLFNVVTFPTHFIVKDGVVVDNFTMNISTEASKKEFIRLIDAQLE